MGGARGGKVPFPSEAYLPALGRLPWLALFLRERILRLLVFFDMGRRG